MLWLEVVSGSLLLPLVADLEDDPLLIGLRRRDICFGFDEAGDGGVETSSATGGIGRASFDRFGGCCFFDELAEESSLRRLPTDGGVAGGAGEGAAAADTEVLVEMWELCEVTLIRRLLAFFSGSGVVALEMPFIVLSDGSKIVLAFCGERVGSIRR